MKKKTILLTTEVSAEVGGFLWFVPLRENALYKMRLSDYVVEYVTWFELENRESYLFARMFCYNEKLFLIPALCQKIVIYDIRKEEKIYLDYKRNYELLGEGRRFGSYIVDNNYLYMMPGTFREIVCINMNNLEMEYYDISEDEIAEGIGAQKGLGYSYRSQEKVADRIYIPVFHHAGILIYNINDKKHEYVYPDGCADVYEGIYKFGNKYILVPKSGTELCVWEEETNKIERRIKLPEEFVSGMLNFYCGKVYDNKLYLLQWYSNMNIVVDLEDMTVQKLELPVQNEIGGIYKWIDIFLYEGNLTVVSGENGEWYTIEGNAGFLHEMNLQYDKDSFCTGMKEKGILYEKRNNIWGLKTFLEMI